MAKQVHYLPMLATRLKDVILSSNLSLTEISQQTGISRSNIYGFTYYGIMPSAYSLYRLCNVLNVSADYLLFGKEGKA